jgi:hypothetical protein
MASDVYDATVSGLSVRVGGDLRSDDIFSLARVAHHVKVLTHGNADFVKPALVL